MLTLLASSPIWLNAGMTKFPTADTHGLSEGHGIHQVGLKPPHVWSSKVASFCHAMQTYLQVQAEADMLCVGCRPVIIISTECTAPVKEQSTVGERGHPVKQPLRATPMVAAKSTSTCAP